MNLLKKDLKRTFSFYLFPRVLDMSSEAFKRPLVRHMAPLAPLSALARSALYETSGIEE